MHNLEIADAHTYFAGEFEAWGHNAPNPYGRRGCPAHQNALNAAVDALVVAGWTVVSGGRGPEEKSASGRFPDAVVRDPNNNEFAVESCVFTKGGIPIAKERRKVTDHLKDFAGVLFVKYK